MPPTTDKRSQGRKNACAIEGFADEKREQLWSLHKDKIKKKPSHRGSNCHIWSGSLQNGYPSLSQGHAQSKIKVHILALWKGKGVLPSEGTVASHLCHNKKCINPDHLICENIKDNNRRKGCLCQLMDSEGSLWNLCPHGPHRCINPDAENLEAFVPHKME